MMQIFNNHIDNETFLNKGFVKFKLLNDAQVLELKNKYLNDVAKIQQQTGGKGFHTTSNTHNIELLKEVDACIKSIVLPELNKYIANTTFTIANFLVKESEELSEVPPHQDWLLVDESVYTSYNIWIALDDANNTSGNLQFVPGSHKFSKNHRAINHPRFFDDFINKLPNYYETVNASPGECVIFHHSIVHGSPANKSGKPRLSCVLGGYFSEADLFFYLPETNKGGNVLKKYSITPNTLLNMKEGYLPDVEVLGVSEIEGEFSKMRFSDFHFKAMKHQSYFNLIKNIIR